jgi:hypothetical protein
MKRNIRSIEPLTVLLILCLPVALATGNPIPIYPDPEPVYTGPTRVSSLNTAWVATVFVIDFFIDILIIYGGVYLLYSFNLVRNRDVFNFSKKVFLSAVLIISIIGLISELLLGGWIGGVLLTLLFIFLSFVLVSKYLLRFSWGNSIRIGLFASLINIVVWIVIFTL